MDRLTWSPEANNKSSISFIQWTTKGDKMGYKKLLCTWLHLLQRPLSFILPGGKVPKRPSQMLSLISSPQKKSPQNQKASSLSPASLGPSPGTWRTAFYVPSTIRAQVINLHSYPHPSQGPSCLLEPWS
ncbi:hypothetical protein ILYODFUR_005858 [Ilyodon furcidens]|uniref:Uncharacterized protein n=1 Tax=Ilyodon furcidens TaxID=33524 RepID=A0ABV0THK6_9TELE